MRCVALRAGARATAEAGNRRRHGVVRQLLSAALLLVSTLTGFVALAPSASAASPTCSFATAGSGTYASTLCWFDLSSYSAATATGASGQTMTMTIPGGYTLTFTLKVSGGAVKAASLPTYSAAYLGNSGYTGVGGDPALYQTATGATTTAALSNIVLKNSSGTTLSGYSLVGADAESTDSSESITWTSSKALASIGPLGNACSGGWTGAGTTSVTCKGSASVSGSKTGTAILASENPSSFSQQMVGGGLQGVAFGVLISQLEFTKNVVNRLGSDAFGITVKDASNNLIGSASTSGTSTATTGVIPVLAGTDGEEYTLAETATTGSLANYSPAWSCTRNGAADATLVKSADGSSGTITLNIGDFVDCTLTNTALSDSLSLVKHAGTPVDVNHDGLVDAGDTIAYTFTVTNNGAVPVTNVGVTDNKAGTVTCPQPSLAVNASETCTASAVYPITAADVTAGSVKNTATASATVTNSTQPVSSPASSTTTATTAPAPSLSLTKSVSPSTVSTAGTQVTYSFKINNTGNETMTNASVTESAFSGSGTLSAITCPAGAASIAPGASATCTATYTVTQADLNAGSVSNTATASAKDPTGTTDKSAASTAKVTINQNPALTLTKSVAPTSATTAGTRLTYSYVVTNSGNLTLTNATINEGTFTGSGALSAVTCPAGAASMAPGAQITCTATYTLTQSDVDTGSVSNTATASATPPTGVTGPTTSSPSTVTMPEPASPALTLAKSVTPTTVTAAGQVLSYSFLVTNTGNVTVKSVGIAETAFSGTGTRPSATCPAGAASMAPGATVTCTATYTVSQADIDSGAISNTATASGTTPSGGTTTSPGSTAKSTATASPALTLTKSVAPTAVGAAGASVTYSYLVKNTGNVTMHGIGITETAFSGTGTAPVVSCPAGAASLAPGATVTCTATYAVTQADVDAGSVTNTAKATGTTPAGATTTSAGSTATLATTAAPALTLAKTVAPTAATAAGQTVTYSFAITNSGNVTITNAGINETTFTGTGTAPVVTCPAGAASIAPGVKVTCTATYVVTQADMDAGIVTNTATASGKSPAGATVTSPGSTAHLGVTTTTTLSVAKSVSPTSATGAGQIVTYSFLVTNTGNVTLHTATISETSFGGTGTPSPVSCPAGAASVAPGASVTCTATYSVTQADADAGGVTNTATASAKDPSGTSHASAPSTAHLTITSTPALTMTKTASPTTVTAAGQTVTYSFAITNTGSVTLHGVTASESAFSGTGTLSAVSCPAGAASLAPGAGLTCTATYVVTQADMDAGGSISNTAAASGIDPSGTTRTSATSSASVGVTRSPSVNLVKSASPSGSALTPGEVITYSFVMTNTGNVTLTNATIVEQSFTGAGAMSAITCPARAASLAPAAQATCTATYTVTQADVDAGTVDNTAIAQATPPTGLTGPTTSSPSTVTMPQAAQPALLVRKTVTPTTVSAPGQSLAYSFRVTNIGNVTMHNVTVGETAFSGTGTLSAVTCPARAASMAPGSQVTCTASYTTTQADIDSGAITNTAVATGTDPAADTITSAGSSATVTVNQHDAITLSLTASPPTVDTVGQLVTYSYLVTNTGNVTLTTMSIDNGAFTGAAMLSPVVCAAGAASMAPAATVTCSATYGVTQADLDAGTISNTATAVADPPESLTGPTVSPDSTAVVDATASPALVVDKSASPTSVSAAGQQVTYSFDVLNTGNVTITDVTIDDSDFSGTGTLGAVSCPSGASSLAPGISVTCTASYTVTQADIDAGSVVNSADAMGLTPGGNPYTSPAGSATLSVDQTPALTVFKSASSASADHAGQTLTYSFLVTNTGNVTMTNISVDDGAFSGTGTLSAVGCPAGAASLAPGDTVTCTATYDVTQADLDAGSITNTATVSGTDPDGATDTSAPSTASVETAPDDSVALVKTVSPASVSTAGQQVTYSFAITNSGDQTLTDATVVDTAFSGTGSLAALSCPAAAASIAPGATVTCTATYTVTQADIDAGSVTNTATAGAREPATTVISSTPSTATLTVAAAPSLSVAKTASPATATTAGQVETYSFVVTNTGDVTLSAVSIDEGTFTGSGLLSPVTCPAGAASMAPGASITCTATYPVTQADIDAGSLSNSATATADPPAGVPGPVISPPSTFTVDEPAGPALTLAKSAAPNHVNAAGQTITYSFLVTNTGNVTMSAISIDESAFTGTGSLSPITCPAGAASLAPGASLTCTASYTITQDDMDGDSQLTNTATATGTDPAGGTDASPPSTGRVSVNQHPGVTLAKSVSPSIVNSAGQTVTYSFTVTSSGNQTVHGVSINEGAFSGTGTLSAATCPAGSLAPGASVTCTASYTVTQADVDAGSVTNTATATALDPSDTSTTSPGSTAVLAVNTGASLTVDKSVSPSTATDAGTPVTYSFLVTNTGNVTMHAVSIAEGQFTGSGAVSSIDCPAGASTLKPSQSVTCTATYTVSQADIDSGGVTNTATVSGQDPSDTSYTSSPSTAVIATTDGPALSLVKSASPASVTAAGRQVTYSFAITNDGNVTITDATVDEGAFTGTGLLSPVSCPAAAASLAPGAQVTCTATYTVTQADIDAGTLTNTATAVGTPPVGVPGPVVSPGSTTVIAEPAQPALTVAKSVAPASVSTAGQDVTYSFLVTNTGNVTVTGVGIDEGPFSGTGTLSAPSCPAPAASLAPAAQVTCTATYAVTQADLDIGSVTNTATATGAGPGGDPVTSPGSTATLAVDAAPAMTVQKTATPTGLATLKTGEVITYSFLVTNTGNVTMSDAAVTDDTFTGTGALSPISCPDGIAELAPQAQVTCTATYTVTQADVDQGTVLNTATVSAIPPHNVHGGVVSPPSTVIMPQPAAPALVVKKTASTAMMTAAGKTITYRFVVSNVGDVTLRHAGIAERHFTGTGTLSHVSCPAGMSDMAPQTQLTCTATYTVTQADLDRGSLTNTATAGATDPHGASVVSNRSTVTLTAHATSALRLRKTAHPVDLNHDGVTDAGDRIEWRIAVRNPGATTIRHITVHDPSAGAVSCPSTTVAPGSSMTCTAAAHTVTTADVSAGQVRNTATGSGVAPDGTTVTAPPAHATVMVHPTPAHVSPPAPSGNLPFTGFGMTKPLVQDGLLLLLAGMLLVIAARHRRRLA